MEVGSSMIPPVSEYSPETEEQGLADFSNLVSDANLVTPQSINSQAGQDATVSDDVLSEVSGYLLKEENQWGWITLYVVTITIAVLGNLLFIIGSLCTSRSRNTGHYLLMNLSVRDILLAGLCIPFTLDSEVIHMTWNLGLEYCISFR